MRNPLAAGIVLAGLVALSPVLADTYHGNNGGVIPKHTTQDHLINAEILAQFMGSDDYGFMASEGTISAGVLIDPFTGVVLISGDDVRDGIFWALMDIQIDSGCIFKLTADSVIAFVPSELALSVTCADGFYACCFCLCGQHYARCYADSSDEPFGGCLGGGTNSPTCAIESSDCD